MIAAAISGEDLWQTALAAFAAGVGTTIVFSLAILGAARFAEASRIGHRFQATVFGALAAIGLLATAGAIVVGVVLIASE